MAGEAGRAVVAASMWINANEFLRNELVLKSRWLELYGGLGMEFPADTVNGIVWVLSGFRVAGVLFALTRRFGRREPLLLGWITGFVMMWLVVGNLAVLPAGLLTVAVPWSLLETGGAVWLCHRLAPVPGRGGQA